VSASGLGPVGNGDPATSVRAPLPEFMEKTEMLLEALLATKRKLPLESMAKDEGLKPVAARGVTSESVPLVESTV